MRSSPPTPFASDRTLRRAALAVAVVVGVVLLVVDARDLTRTLGDPDDALRMAIVRDLLHGRGWFDQRIDRLQPPLGTYMHWSRLLDGALALTMKAAGLVLKPGAAELAVRAFWPLAWIFPAALAALAAARRLAGEAAAGWAVLIGAVVLALEFPLYAQFRPGRVDHHDVQITLCLLALAGACARGAGLRGALGAGLATALGLAIGVEALPFEAAIGAGLALEYVCDPASARRAKAYGLGLAGAALALYAVQTPPARLGLSVCDALGANLTLALAAAGAGLFAAASLTAKQSWRVRLAAVAAVGAAALGLYLALKPACTAGVFAEVDPRLRPFWFDHVNELSPIGLVFKHKPTEAAGLVAGAVIGLGAAAVLAWLDGRARRLDPAVAITGVCLLLAVATGFAAERMSVYILWFAVPPAVALVARAVARAPDRALAIGRRIGLAAVPLTFAAATLAACGVIRTSDFLPDPPDPCFDTTAYAVLARQRPGVALGEIDVGSYVLANTRSSALAAPYHRMAWGDLATHAALAAPVGRALEQVRALKADYVLECRAHSRHWDRSGMAADALQRRLDAGRPPPWLQPLSPKGSALEIYRVASRN
jgi:hypothetical protein